MTQSAESRFVQVADFAKKSDFDDPQVLLAEVGRSRKLLDRLLRVHRRLLLSAHNKKLGLRRKRILRPGGQIRKSSLLVPMIVMPVRIKSAVPVLVKVMT